MRVILDTNVFISGVFFNGPPFRILDAWRSGRIELVLSSEILDEYRRTAVELALRHDCVDLGVWLQLVSENAAIVVAKALGQPICSDPDDDKFLACAFAGKVRVVISGYKALLSTSGYQGIEVVTPRQFVDTY